MALEIEWTAEAVTQLDELIAYLEAPWTDKEIRHFFTQLEKGLSTMSTNPEQHKQPQRKPNRREYHVTPLPTLFYDFDETVVTVLLLWPNRMNPANL